jgi:PadR family transcriptional regulator, regulatory protein AphA
MSLKHAILGFLSYKPMNGYDLKKAFDKSVRHFWPANQSQIYRTLSQMMDEGLLDVDVIEREDQLAMKIYQISENGKQELHHWLATPLPVRETREPFLLQVFFGGQLSDEELLVLLKHEVKTAEDDLEIYTQIHQASIGKAGQAGDPRAFYLSMLSLDYGIRSSQAIIDWLNNAIEQIESKTYTIPPLKKGCYD